MSSPPISIREVARRLGVSPVAVCQALGAREGGSVRLSPERRAEILAGAKALRYRPNDDLVLVLPHGAEEEAQLLRWVAACEAAAAEQGLRLQVETGADPASLRTWRVGGAILLDHLPPSLVSSLDARGIPWVALNPQQDLPHGAVICDDQAGLGLAVERLRSLGATAFGLILPRIRHASFEARITALRDAAGSDPILVADQRDPQEAFAACQPLVRPGTGWLVLGDWWLAFDGWLAGKGLGLEERRRAVAVKSPLSAWVRPPLVLDLPVAEMARAAVSLVKARWAGRRATASLRMAPRLVAAP